MVRLVAALALSMAAVLSLPLAAQALPADRTPAFEVAFTGIGVRALQVGSGQSFGQAGGSGSIAVRAFRNLSVVAEVTGTHTNSAGLSGVPLSLVTATFGARYRVLNTRRFSVYGQGLLGEANGFDSLFPSRTGLQNTSSSLALQAGAGLDISVRRHVAVRVLEAGWVRTQFPNGQDNVQNSLRLGAGAVFRFR